MLQTGFVSFLEWHSESLTTEQVRVLLSRNIPRLGDNIIADLQQAIAQIKPTQTPPTTPQ
jgi:hypothetical protein